MNDIKIFKNEAFAVPGHDLPNNQLLKNGNITAMLEEKQG